MRWAWWLLAYTALAWMERLEVADLTPQLQRLVARRRRYALIALAIAVSLVLVVIAVVVFVVWLWIA